MTSTGTSLEGALLDRRYRVGTLLARGGMSSVYRGVDTRLDRPVAVKVMDSRFADDRSFVERFEREARAAARLHHPHVVAVHDQGFDTPDGPESRRAFLVMELVDGGTLRDVLQWHGRLDAALALTVFEQVLSALAAAHAAGLVHRDVKPENVLVGSGDDSGGVVKVGDFGLVRAVANAGTTSTSVILGTVAYLSPEQVTSGAAGERADVYSAGILLYEMLTGQVPYTADTALSVAYRHVNDDVPPPGRLVADLPPALDELVVRATRRDPDARPANAGVLLAEVSRVRAELGLSPARIPVPARHDVATAGGPDGPDPTASTGARTLHDLERTVPAIPAVSGDTAGPRGTRALPREPVAASGAGTGPADDGTGSGAYRAAGGAPRRRGPVLLWALLGVLLLGGLGAGVWWFSDGRYVDVPAVAGQDRDRALNSLRAAGLDARVAEHRHNTTPSGTVISTDPGGGARALPGDDITVLVSLGRPVVPDVPAGASEEQAREAIAAMDLEPRHDAEADRYHENVPQGAVVTLDPKPGSQANVGDTVTIVLSRGPPPTPVPEVTGQSRDQAFETLRRAGFQPYDAGAEFSGEVPAGQVVRTEPKAGQTAGDGARVGVVVSNAVEVPSVVGRRPETAARILSDAGLGVAGGNGRGPISIVIGQDPAAGSLVKPDTTVNLTVVP